MRKRLFYLLWIALAVLFYLWSNSKEALLLVVILVAVVPVLVLLNVMAVGRISVETHVRQKDAEKNIITVGTVIHNRSWCPAFQVQIEMELRNLLTDSCAKKKFCTAVLPRHDSNYKFQIESLYCGKVEVDIQSVCVRDLLGISGFKAAFTGGDDCYIYPETLELSADIAELYQQKEETNEERYVHKKGNDITEILNLRDYQKGDTIKSIHWKLSKKLGHKVVKELDMPTSQEVILMMALSSEMENNEGARNLLAQKLLNVSELLLQEQIFYDAVLLREEGASYSLYSIQESKSRDWYEQRLLDGQLTWSRDCVENYMAEHHVLNKYASVILVTDQGIADWYSEYPQVMHIVADSF